MPTMPILFSFARSDVGAAASEEANALGISGAALDDNNRRCNSSNNVACVAILARSRSVS